MTKHLVNKEEQANTFNKNCLRDTKLILKQHRACEKLRFAYLKLNSNCIQGTGLLSTLSFNPTCSKS